MNEPTGFEEFIKLSEAETLRKIRKYYGMAKLGTAHKPCIRCGKDMLTQTISGRRIQFRCSKCRYNIPEPTAW